LEDRRTAEERHDSRCQMQRLATMLRAKADGERDPEIRAGWKYIARGYLILANEIERNDAEEIIYSPFARSDVDEEAA
jgi:hypothetical protein